MSVTQTDGVILLAGECTVEDAEELLRLLIQAPDAPVDIAGSGHLHMAVAQLLLAAHRDFRGGIPNSFFGNWVLPHLLHASAVSTPAA